MQRASIFVEQAKSRAVPALLAAPQGNAQLATAALAVVLNNASPTRLCEPAFFDRSAEADSVAASLTALLADLEHVKRMCAESFPVDGERLRAGIADYLNRRAAI